MQMTMPGRRRGVFPKTLQSGLQAAVEHRTLDRVAKNVDDVPVAVEPDILECIGEMLRRSSDRENLHSRMIRMHLMELKK